jgi:hypothetical protein
MSLGGPSWVELVEAASRPGTKASPARATGPAGGPGSPGQYSQPPVGLTVAEAVVCALPVLPDLGPGRVSCRGMLGPVV